MTLTTIGMFLLGLIVLLVGAEALVRGASKLALDLGISPLVVGLTVVAFGTSAPELVVSVHAALTGASDIALGNVVGSNICNILLILGVSSLIRPLHVAPQLIRLDVPIMIALSLLLLLMSLDGSVSEIEGSFLVLLLIGYTSFSVMKSKQENVVVRETIEQELKSHVAAGSVGRQFILVALGLGMLILGGHWLVDAAIAIAKAYQVSDLVIALTVVAVGTSFPELATSVIASIKGERDIAIGNIIGSNIFNILAVLGTAAAVSSTGVPVAPAALSFDLPVMVVVAFCCLPIFFTGLQISRWEGALFLFYYTAYTVFLVLTATSHHALPVYSFLMLSFVIPLTVVTLIVVTGRTLKGL